MLKKTILLSVLVVSLTINPYLRCDLKTFKTNINVGKEYFDRHVDKIALAFCSGVISYLILGDLYKFFKEVIIKKELFATRRIDPIQSITIPLTAIGFGITIPLIVYTW